ncbi:MAG: UbiA family prenyltransferase, partial [Candidatus Micrarchaeota archaeon]
QQIRFSPSLFQDFMSLTKINRTGTSIASLIGGVGFAAGFSESSLILILQGAITFIFSYVPISMLNDVVDAEADKLNESDRPIARGALSPRTVIVLAALVFLAGVAISSAFSTAFLGILLLGTFLGILYCYWAKRNGLFSYMLLGCTHIAIPFVAGAILAGGFSEEALLVGAYVFLTMFLCIVIKDFKDIDGDRLAGVKTFPILYGEKNAYKLTALAFLMAPLTFFLPWVLLHLSVWFVGFYSLVAAWKLKTAKILLKFPSPDKARRILDFFRFAVIGEMLAWSLARSPILAG